MSNQIWRRDATAQAALVRAGEVSARELVDASLERIARLNPQVNAVIHSMAEEARRLADEHRRPDPPADADAPFAGVPLLVKDASLQIEGTPYCIGLGVLRDAGYRSTHTTELAHRLARAGFVIIGKTNVPELSAATTTEPAAFGPTRNPWNPSRSAAGSSGGSAAAVASGMTSVAHGADGTGSLRYPAAACGVVTLKPTAGLVPTETPTGAPDTLGVWAEFVLARSVRDLAGVLDAVSNAPPGVVPADALASPPRRLRIGLLRSDVFAGIPTHDACVDAVDRAGALLASLGHHVEEAHPPALAGIALRIGQQIAVLLPGMRDEQLGWVERMIGRPLRDGEAAPQHVAERAQAASITAGARAAAEQKVRDEAEPVLRWWRDGWDILVTPTLRQPAWPLGSHGGAADSGVFPVPFSITGQPAMSLPLYTSAEGLPVGVQIVGAPGRDALLLQLAAELEHAEPWSARWPAFAGGVS